MWLVLEIDKVFRVTIYKYLFDEEVDRGRMIWSAWDWI